MSSYRKVNYSLRPAKHAQRRMMAELLSCLYPFRPVRNYRYVGFGSLWFEDFKLFHRILGYRDMISIERSGATERFEANRPYQAVRILFGDSNAKLQEIPWDIPSVLWLDYDSAISTSSLLDIRTVAGSMVSGSVIAVTLNVEEADELVDAKSKGEEPATALELFRSRFGEFVRGSIFSDDLIGRPFRALCREVLASQLESVLATRNVGVADEEQLSGQLVCQFNYADGHSMSTFVFVLFKNADAERFNSCDFSSLDFLAGIGDSVDIQMPVMTLKEIRQVESQLPSDDLTQIVTSGVPPGDVQKFSRIYRYLPNFAVLES
ncbi:O-methyltransferase [Ruegeria pomeroyi]|uniref:O-methyltransferase n=1 Tax=Ruegeria pomeroyi TaxID=89184 RepID=UPI001F1E3EE4|nr:O-methyltransferase [Ruegeria pomeroyi]